jgi:hypothetical protein
VQTARITISLVIIRRDVHVLVDSQHTDMDGLMEMQLTVVGWLVGWLAPVGGEWSELRVGRFRHLDSDIQRQTAKTILRRR